MKNEPFTFVFVALVIIYVVIITSLARKDKKTNMANLNYIYTICLKSGLLAHYDEDVIRFNYKGKDFRIYSQCILNEIGLQCYKLYINGEYLAYFINDSNRTPYLYFNYALNAFDKDTDQIKEIFIECGKELEKAN